MFSLELMLPSSVGKVSVSGLREYRDMAHVEVLSTEVDLKNILKHPYEKNTVQSSLSYQKI